MASMSPAQTILSVTVKEALTGEAPHTAENRAGLVDAVRPENTVLTRAVPGYAGDLPGE